MYASVLYRRLSPQFQFSLSAVTLVYLSQWFIWPKPAIVYTERRHESTRELAPSGDMFRVYLLYTPAAGIARHRS